MHANWGDSDFWKLAFGGFVNLLAGSALLCVRRWMRNADRDRAEHKREIEAKLAASVSSGNIHAGSAAAGSGNGLDKSADSSPHRSRGRISDRER